MHHFFDWFGIKELGRGIYTEVLEVWKLSKS